jgi:hypothetical protein
MFKTVEKGLIKLDHKLLFQTLFYYTASIIIFAIIYFSLYKSDSSSFTKPEHKKEYDLFDFIHFSLVTQTTVGYGTMSPLSRTTKIVNLIQLLTIYGVFIISMI